MPDTAGQKVTGIQSVGIPTALELKCVLRIKGSQTADSRDWYFEDAIVQTAIELTRELMEKYSIPAERVIRHYDVTGKICPNPYVYNHTQHTWDTFKKTLALPKHSGRTSLAVPAWFRYRLQLTLLLSAMLQAEKILEGDTIREIE